MMAGIEMLTVYTPIEDSDTRYLVEADFLDNPKNIHYLPHTASTSRNTIWYRVSIGLCLAVNIILLVGIGILLVKISTSNINNQNTQSAIKNDSITDLCNTTNCSVKNISQSTHEKACSTPECVILAGEILSKMNLSVDPCHDFYLLTCGRFSKPENRAPDIESWSTFLQQSTANYRLIEVLLTTEGSEYIDGHNSSALLKAKKFYATCLSSYFDTTIGRFKLSGAERPGQPKWERCVEKTIGMYELAIGVAFAKEFVPDGVILDVDHYMQEIRAAFIDNLQDITWLDSEKKGNIKKKAEDIRWELGYPNISTHLQRVDNFYENFNPSKSFFDGVDEWRNYSIKQLRDLHRLRIGESEWVMPPTEVNAYYDPLQNKIVVPAGLLQPPIYRLDAPTAIFYGSFVSILGHEFIHAFYNLDSSGEDDEFRSWWWNKPSNVEYEKKKQCFMDQYSNRTFYGQQLDGTKSIQENIADSGGISLSYTILSGVLNRTTSDPKIDVRLANLDLMARQQFFLSYAQLWCLNTDASAARALVRLDPHSPGPFRVNVVLQNNKEFAKAFNCPKGSPMNPISQCKIW